MYCNRCQTLIDQRYIDKFKSLDMSSVLYELPTTEWANDLVAPQNGDNNVTIDRKLLANGITVIYPM